MKLKLKYIIPKVEFELIAAEQLLLVASQPTQCHCYEHDVNGGCQGCKGNCGCNHWDSEQGALIPGC